MRDIGLAHPVSEAAFPPIRPDEAKDAELAICPYHKSRFVDLNVEGRVYLCPIGRMLWRASKQQGGMYKPLKFARNM